MILDKGYCSIYEVANTAKALGLSDYSHISSVCNGRRKTAYGYTWEHVEKTI
jgi:hypothetical protein